MAPKLLRNGSQRDPGALLEASWEPFGDDCPYFAPILPSSEPPGMLLDASGAEKKISWAALGRSKTKLKTGFNSLAVHKAPKTEPKIVPNRAPEATRAENGETLIFYDSIRDLVDFQVPRLSSGSQK